MKYLLMLIVVSLVGCATAPTPLADRHDLEFTAQPVHKPKRVEWIVVEDVTAVCQGNSLINKGKEYICRRKLYNS